MAKSKKEPKVQLEDLNDEQRKRLGRGLTDGVVALTYIDDVKATYADNVSSLADELGIEPALIKQAITRMYKKDYFDKLQKQDDIETILQITGNLPEQEDE